MGNLAISETSGKLLIAQSGVLMGECCCDGGGGPDPWSGIRTGLFIGRYCDQVGSGKALCFGGGEILPAPSPTVRRFLMSMAESCPTPSTQCQPTNDRGIPCQTSVLVIQISFYGWEPGTDVSISVNVSASGYLGGQTISKYTAEGYMNCGAGYTNIWNPPFGMDIDWQYLAVQQASTATCARVNNGGGATLTASTHGVLAYLPFNIELCKTTSLMYHGRSEMVVDVSYERL